MDFSRLSAYPNGPSRAERPADPEAEAYTERYQALRAAGVDRDAALGVLRHEGARFLLCMVAVARVEGLPFGEAKAAVHDSPAWADGHADREAFWAEVAQSLAEGAAEPGAAPDRRPRRGGRRADGARLGRLVLIAFTAFTAFSMAGGAVLQLQHHHRLGSCNIIVILLSCRLVLWLWEGVRWARWTLVGLSAVGLVLWACAMGGVQGIDDGLDGGLLLDAVDAATLALGIGLAAPWVGAYLAVRRGAAIAECGGG